MFNSSRNALPSSISREVNPALLNNQAQNRTAFQPLTTGLTGRSSRPGGGASSVNLNPVKLNRSMSEAQVAATGAARVQVGRQTLYIGTRQVSANNQDPIVMAFEQGRLRWTRTDYETTGTDGRGMGLFYNGTALYGVFSVDGTQGRPAQDFRRVTTEASQPWMRSYGSGGGAKVAVIARLNPSNGALQSAVYLSGNNNGRSNSFQVRGLSMHGNNLWVSGQSWFAPRNVDGSAMTPVAGSTAASPFTYQIELPPDLKQAVRSSATGWVSQTSPSAA